MFTQAVFLLVHGALRTCLKLVKLALNACRTIHQRTQDYNSRRVAQLYVTAYVIYQRSVKPSRRQ